MQKLTSKKGNLDTRAFKTSLGKLFKIMSLVMKHVHFLSLWLKASLHITLHYLKIHQKRYTISSKTDLAPKPALSSYFLKV